MSSGPFVRTFYQLSAENGGEVAPIRLQPQTLEAQIAGTANAAPPGPATIPGSATISQGRRSAGINARYVTIAWDGAPPTGYSSLTARITVPDPVVYAGASLGSPVTYLDTSATVVGRTPETIK